MVSLNRVVAPGILALAGLPVGTSAQEAPGLILGDTIVAVGTRGQPRSVTESAVPVDVVTTEESPAKTPPNSRIGYAR